MNSPVICDTCIGRDKCKHLKPSNPTGELCPAMETIINAPAFQWPRERYLEDLPAAKGKHRPLDADDVDMASQGISKGSFQKVLKEDETIGNRAEYEPESKCRSYLDEYADDQDAKVREHAAMHNEVVDMPHKTFEETRKKMIAAGAFFGVPIEMISLVLKVNESTVRRTAKRMPPVKVMISDE